MLTEPIIDIIVYGFPTYLPISLHEFIYITTDCNEQIYLSIKNENTNVTPILSNNILIVLPIREQTYIINKNELVSINLLISNCESFISLLDTRDYFDWIRDIDEKWSDNPNVTNSEYIRGAGSQFNTYLYGKCATNIKPTLSLNAKVGILFDWLKDENETWDDNQNITNQDYIQTLIG